MTSKRTEKGGIKTDDKMDEGPCRTGPSTPRTPEGTTQLAVEKAPDDTPLGAGNELKDDEISLHSAVEQGLVEQEDLRVGQCKGEKKPVKILNVYKATERIARDLTWGTIKTKDGGQAYSLEVGQTD